MASYVARSKIKLWAFLGVKTDQMLMICMLVATSYGFVNRAVNKIIGYLNVIHLCKLDHSTVCI